MKHFYQPGVIYFLLIFLCCQVSATGPYEVMEQHVPSQWRDHPEYGRVKPVNAALQHNYELIHLRTAYSRVFIDQHGIYTTALSSVPLHTRNTDGVWVSIVEAILPDEIFNTAVNDSTIINSCFFPVYQSADLVIDIPQEHTILNTWLEWEFTAVSQGWMADQRSYVSSSGGQTPVQAGTGSSSGTKTYSMNSGIANGQSTGQIPFTFFASRTWGGSGCNATFNFIRRRYIEITHGEIIFGEGEVVVNEYSASNRQWTDDFGNYEDWIELYNPSASFVDLTGYYLSDNPSSPLKWQMPGGMLPPGGHLVIICSGRDEMVGFTPHASFKLTQTDPESILLSDPQGNLLEQHELFLTQNGHSYGRIVSGDEQWGIFKNPSPGYYNSGHWQGYTPMPQIMPEPGFYDNPKEIQIMVPAGGVQIRYTVDGSEPTMESMLYTLPIIIDQTTVVRARAFSLEGSWLPGFIETQTYFINQDHYLPVFSFSGNELNVLFGGSQIETIGSVEFFDENGVNIDKTVADFNKHGNDSWSYPQRGVDFIARDEYGYSKELNHRFFSTSDRRKFQRLMVKAAANDNYPFEGGGAHIRDSYIQTLSQLSGLDLDERSSTSVVVYVNGQYWGLYDLRERVDDVDYTEYYYDQYRQYKGSEEYLQFLKTWSGTQAHFGEQRALNEWQNLRSFISSNNMGTASNFEYVDTTLNIGSLIDYFVINSWVVSRDWLNYNTGWWRGLHPDGEAQQWRYILWDMEAALGHFNNYTGIPDVTANAAPCNVENITVGNGHAQSLKKLITENPEARYRYVTRYADLMNTWLSCDHALHVLDSMVNHIEPEMHRQIARWGGNIATWQGNVQNVRNFVTQRCQALVNGLRSCYNLNGPWNVTFQSEPPGAGNIKMNSVWLPGLPFHGSVYGGIETRLWAEGIGPYVLSHWEVPAHSFVNIGDSTAISLTLTQDETITAHFINPNLEGKQLIYYWHFNELDTSEGDVTSIPADFSLIPGITPEMIYQGSGERDIDAYNTGSTLNLHLFEGAGTAARVRNPSAGRSLLFHMPTTGYGDLVFEYAVHRSPQGMDENIIYYSLDGVNFSQEGLEQSYFEITEDYQLLRVDLGGVFFSQNNPDFHLKIEFGGNTTQSNGNNRFDNISLKGETYIETSAGMYARSGKVIVFPNPSRDDINIVSRQGIEQLRIMDIRGSVVYEKKYTGETNLKLNPGTLIPGIYLVNVTTRSGHEQVKIVRY